MITCPHDGCGCLFHYDDEFHHQIGCPRASCACTEPGCHFAASPVGLVIHLQSAHSIPLLEFRYGVPNFFLLPVPLPGSPRRLHFAYGADGSVFVLIIGQLGPVAAVSFLCVRSAAWLWPEYTVTMWVKGRHSLEGSSQADYSRDSVKAVIEAKSSTSPGTVELEEMTSFLPVPPRYLVGVGPSKQVGFRVLIDKKNRS